MNYSVNSNGIQSTACTSFNRILIHAFLIGNFEGELLRQTYYKHQFNFFAQKWIVKETIWIVTNRRAIGIYLK